VKLILASQSSTRQAMLSAAGVAFDAVRPDVDEDSAKMTFRARGLSSRDLANALAELKAVKISNRYASSLVLGCDQTLALDDGTMFDKAETFAALAIQLAKLSGKTHVLTSAAVIAQGGQAVWRHIEQCQMTVRTLSPDFIDDYIEREGEALLGCVGGYRIEARGIQLFAGIKGSYHAILGLPLIPLLDYLRTRGVMTS
jgi:septum formation protein